jgi:hypothetical protein
MQFDDVSTSAGLSYRGESFGASWGDFNGDGFSDLFVGNHRARPSLYINRGDGTFVDFGTQVDTFVNKSRADTHGAGFMDFDNDGDQDLLISTGSGNPGQFLVNDRGEPSDQAQRYGLALEGQSYRSAIWLDYNGDKLADVIMVSKAKYGEVMQQGANHSFASKNGVVGFGCKRFHYGQLLDVNGDNMLDILCGAQERGAGKNFPQFAYDTRYLPFRDVTANTLQVAQTVDSTIADFDGDLREDIFQLRGVLRPSDVVQTGNRIEALLIGGKKGFKFASNGTLTVDIHWNKGEETGGDPNIRVGARGFNPRATSFTLDPNDPNVIGLPPYTDSDLPLITIGYDPDAKLWYFRNIAGKSFSDAYFIVSSSSEIRRLKAMALWPTDRPVSPTLSLHRATGFEDGTVAAGLSTPISCISAVAGDFDNDMDVDIYAACRSGAANLANVLYENVGGGRFVALTGAAGAAGPVGVAVADGVGTADTVVSADYDRDGFLDLYVTNGFNMRPVNAGGPEKLFHNRGNANHWIELELAATGSMRDALGARVLASASGVTQLRVANGAYHRWAQDSKQLHFGLREATRVDLRVEWPSGRVDLFPGVAADKLYRITEGAAGVTEIPRGRANPIPCGMAGTHNPSSDAIYVWKDCPSQTWKVRAAAASGSAIYSGALVSTHPLTAVDARGLEANDVLDNASNAARIRFAMQVNQGTLDGFDFAMPTNARGCFQVDLPAGTRVFFGGLATPVVAPFDVQTGGACL